MEGSPRNPERSATHVVTLWDTGELADLGVIPRVIPWKTVEPMGETVYLGRDDTWDGNEVTVSREADGTLLKRDYR